MTFTAAELAYLRDQPIGRLDDRHVGYVLGRNQKWRNVIRNPWVAFTVDDVISVQPPSARGIEIRGTATRATPTKSVKAFG